MKFRRFGAVSLAAILAATSTAIVSYATSVNSEGAIEITKAELDGKDKIVVKYSAEEDITLKMGAAVSPDWKWFEYEFTAPAGSGKTVEIALADVRNSFGIDDVSGFGDLAKIYIVNGTGSLEGATLEGAAAETTADETTAAVEEEVEAVDEDVDAELEDEDDADATASLSLEDIIAMYDVQAATELNASFKLGGKLDLLAILGADWDKFTKIEADFTWTPGEKWCGGAGIGSAVNGVDGSTWIMGTEFGAANANEGVAGDGKATQTILDMGTPLVSIVSIGDDGTVNFGELQVQNWWNGEEAGAKVEAIRFLDASGNVVAEVNYGTAAAETPVEVVTTGDVEAATDSSKGSPDTGIEDVAAIAGLAVVAAGAVVVAKKRK